MTHLTPVRVIYDYEGLLQWANYFLYGMNRRRTQRLDELTTLIKEIDERHAASPSADLYRERVRWQTKFDISSTDRAEKLHLKSRYNHYELGSMRTNYCLTNRQRQKGISQRLGLRRATQLLTNKKLTISFKNSISGYTHRRP